MYRFTVDIDKIKTKEDALIVLNNLKYEIYLQDESKLSTELLPYLKKTKLTLLNDN